MLYIFRSRGINYKLIVLYKILGLSIINICNSPEADCRKQSRTISYRSYSHLLMEIYDPKVIFFLSKINNFKYTCVCKWLVEINPEKRERGRFMSPVAVSAHPCPSTASRNNGPFCNSQSWTLITVHGQF